MDLNDLKLFARAAELGNITRAAEESGYTQSAASHALRRLERELGLELLQRLHTGVCLTADGRSLLPYVSEMLMSQERLLQKAAALSSEVSGVITVGCISSVAIRWLPELIEGMHQRYPSVQLRFQEGSYEAVEEWILRKKVEVGFLSSSTRQALHLTPLLEDDLLLVLPKGHPLCALEEVPLSCLQAQRIIIPADSLCDIGAILRASGFAPAKDAGINSDYAALSLVAQGRGVTILPRVLLDDHDDARVCLRRMEGHPTRTICMATLPQARLSPAAKAFSRYALDFFRTT